MINKELNILIVEDEFAVALDIKVRLELMRFNVTKIASSLEEAIYSIVMNKPDVVLMDINISGNNSGIEAAKTIWEKFKIPIVYLTGINDNEILNTAIENTPFGLILKPFNDICLKNQLLIANQQKTSNDLFLEKIKKYELDINNFHSNDLSNETFFIKNNKQIIKIHSREITYIEAMDNYTLIYSSTNEKFILNGFLKDILVKLNLSYLIRIHRSYAVSSNFITKIEEDTVLVNKRLLPISKTYRTEFYKFINPI